MADSDIPAEAVEADHYHPCDGLLCAPGEWLSDLGRHGGPVRMADLRARVLAEVAEGWQAYLRSHPRRAFENQFADYLRDVLGDET
jgi:hypothetical protein